MYPELQRCINCTTNCHHGLFKFVVREQEAMKEYSFNLTDITTVYRSVCVKNMWISCNIIFKKTKLLSGAEYKLN